MLPMSRAPGYPCHMSSSKPPVRFCINNPRNLAERQDLIARGIPSKDCLGNCSACFEGRFLEIQGEIVPGESYQDILDSANDTTADST